MIQAHLHREDIYMQWLNDEGELVGEITWCNDKIHERDIKFKRVYEDEYDEAEFLWNKGEH